MRSTVSVGGGRAPLAFAKDPLCHRKASDIMKRIHRIILILCCLLLSFPALAEHRTYLRGIVNVPGLQVALIEIQHTLAKPTNAPPVIITTSRLVRARQQFEDDTIKGAHFLFEVLEVDLAKETVKTREAGEEHIYTLPGPKPSATAKSHFDLQNAAFNDVIDLYSELEKRVLLQHPAIDRAPVSLEAVWTNQAPEKAEVTDVLVKYLNQRGISVVVDGAKFLQLVPSALNLAASPRSKDLPARAAEVGGMTLMGIEAGKLPELYGTHSGRRRIGNEWVAGSVPYLKVTQPLSKPEVLYALETLLAWNDARILLSDDNTFSIVRTSR